MIFLLDSNSCIGYLNGRSANIRQHMEAVQPQEVMLCSVVKAELIYGAMKSARVAENFTRIEAFASRFVSLPFDDAAAEAYGDIRVRLERQGRTIGPNDLLIAAIALARNVTLVTHNTREFSRIEELRLEDWE